MSTTYQPVKTSQATARMLYAIMTSGQHHTNEYFKRMIIDTLMYVVPAENVLHAPQVDGWFMVWADDDSEMYCVSYVAQNGQIDPTPTEEFENIASAILWFD